jgi:tripartite-type tricarboxylate transporter receptor subunit TctC
LRALAVGGTKRDPHFPDVPTLREAGYPDIGAETWVGVFAPAGTPAAIVARLNAEIERVIHDPDVAANLGKQGIAIDGGPPEVLGRLVAAEIARWRSVAQTNHISVQR